MSAPETRRALLDRLRDSLETTGQAVLFGPWGTGKTTLLRALAAEAEYRGERVLRLTAYRADTHLPYSALGQLLPQLPEADLNALPQPSQRVLRLLMPGQPADQRPDPAAAAAALATVLGRLSHALLLVDDTQWLDHASLETLARPLHALTPDVLRTVAAERCARSPHAAWLLCGHHPAAVALPGWDIDEIAALLGDRGLPTRYAGPLHRLTGGNPVLTHAALADLTDDPTRPEALAAPPLAVHLATGWLAELPYPVRRTLQVVALAHHSGPALLRRIEGADADAHIAEAERAGILATRPSGSVGFAAELLREAALADLHHAALSRLHQVLANEVDDPLQAVRHRLLADDAPSQATAAQAEEAGAWARSSGERDLAAELLLIAAERTPADQRPEKLRRLAAAATDAAASRHAALAHRVHEAVTAARPGPGEHVSALLAILDAGGQALDEMELVLSRARQAAHGDRALLAAVELRAAIRANVSGAGPAAARDAAAESARLARKAGDRCLEAMALTMLARMERLVGDPAAPDTLAAALALDVPLERIGVSDSPQYLAVRFAVFDDHLHEAHERAIALLPVAENGGDAENVEEVLRSLAEIAARSGHAGQALVWSERALDLCSAAGLSLGPAWYTASVAQSAGGSFEQAIRYAACGLAASREEHDAIFTSRNLLALATARLITGGSGAAVECLREIADIESGQHVADPRVLRWQPELAEALVAAGELDAADDVLRQVNEATDEHVRAGGVGAAITRAHALLAGRRGQTDTAVTLLDQASRQFADLGLVIEQGRTLIAHGRIERGRRRPAAARAAWQQASTLFETAHARPWQGLCKDLLDRLEHQPRGAAAADTAHGLTEAERRLAAIIAQGASNQEAAGQLFLSVKTVEATLSRIYRKLGVRSRTQLAKALGT